MDPERTTTMGDGESATTESPFHNIKAVESTTAKLRTWRRNWRGWSEEREPNILTVRAVLIAGRERRALLKQDFSVTGEQEGTSPSLSR